MKKSNAVITVIGKDTVGILAKVTALCSDSQANIVEVTQSVLGDMFTMIMMVDISGATVEFNVTAQDALFVYPADGGSAQSASLDNIQRLTFSGDNLLLKTTNGNETTYPLAAVGKITFEVAGTGISALPSAVEINLYPNPSVNYIRIDSPVAITSWTLFDLSGNALKHSSSDLQIQVSNLLAGFYFLKIDTANGTVTKKIIKQ